MEQADGQLDFKPQVNLKISVKISNTPYGCSLSSSSNNSNYSNIWSTTSTSLTTYSGTLTPAYYYRVSGAYFSAYLKDTNGSAIRFVH